MKEKNEASQRWHSLIWFILSVALVFSGVFILIPILKGYGLWWTLLAIVFLVYHGNNTFSQKRFSLWEETFPVEEKED